MKSSRIIGIMLGALLTLACTDHQKTMIISAINTLEVERSHETVELTTNFLGIEDLRALAILDMETGEELITQLVDTDNDGTMDVLLFQPNLAPKSKKNFKIIARTEQKNQKTIEYCYSRFVPERTDDYAWENDRVAFRVFGPTAQRMHENGIGGGTLSSGVDAWLKKVEYPIINKWYRKATQGVGSYHEDTGEGLDNFHVGISRGVGGTAIKNGDNYNFSKNYIDFKTICTGPLRTSFMLVYDAWDANGRTIKEYKTISLDRGSNLSKIEVTVTGMDELAAGLTLHEKKGTINIGTSNTWASHWEPHEGSELGTGIVSEHPFLDVDNYQTETLDLSNLYVHLRTNNGKVTYYTGFGWKESGHFKTREAWEHYLDLYSKKINSPIKIELVP
ncbi:DUF4861 family protein [Maribacter sp. 2304DJ31-5]|uniref:DUF4861 family protein n=1 Tax=Maribacter sp. 2304DJ31-5 TaxID=3386273 RepID=UPI0039BC9D0C